MTKHYLVIYTDHGDSCDGLARVLGVYETEEKAKHEMDSDVKYYQRTNHHPMSTEYRAVMVGDQLHGCQWQILEVEM